MKINDYDLRLGDAQCQGFCAIVFAGTLILLPFSSTAQSVLPLDAFLNQVATKNQTFEASRLSSDAAKGKTEDAEMVYAPTAFASIQAMQDKKEQSPVTQRGDQTDYAQASGGVSKLWDTGTVGKVTYTTSQTNVRNTDPRFVAEPEWYDASTTLEVSHPLLKNAGGKDIHSTIELAKTQSQLLEYQEAFKRKMTLTEAESVYWRLVIARESVRTSKENLERAQKIVQWNAKRVSNELADSSDLVQAQALADVREIELNLAENEERAASHQFNTARGAKEAKVAEDLTPITPDLIASLKIPAKEGTREDLALAKESIHITDLQMSLAEDKYEPSLDLFAQYAFNGRDADGRFKAMSEGLTPQHPTWGVGLKFSAPLGGDTVSRLRGAYAKDKQAATLNADRKQFEIDREWEDLNLKLNESKSRLNLVQKVELTQKKKLDLERERWKKGRSTMFQVMQFESDLAAAQLNLIKSKSEILGIIARMKTFGGAM
jgi:outer membrane protein TolC